MTETKQYRGSRCHVLDWTSRETFSEELQELLAPLPVTFAALDRHLPRGWESEKEVTLDTFGLPMDSKKEKLSRLQSWLVHQKGAKTPTWDIICSRSIEGSPGLVLVEAKANVQELSEAGKPLSQTASDKSKSNHERIGVAIADACAALRQLHSGVRLSHDSHYQLANRLAFTWKLASLGIPTILVYLGFVGDSGLKKGFSSNTHWRESFRAYSCRGLPDALIEQILDCDKAPAWIAIRSRQVLVPSPELVRSIKLGKGLAAP